MLHVIWDGKHQQRARRIHRFLSPKGRATYHIRSSHRSATFPCTPEATNRTVSHFACGVIAVRCFRLRFKCFEEKACRPI
jgi:hypothetical protein